MALFGCGLNSLCLRVSFLISQPPSSMLVAARNKQRSWRILSLLTTSLCTLTFLYLSPDLLNVQRGGNRSVVEHNKLPSLIPLDPNRHHEDVDVPSVPAVTSHSSPPNITLIAIWNPRTNSPPQPYLSNFFASVQGNAPLVNLLFVIFDKHDYGCDKRITPSDMTNVKEICFDPREYWQLHVDYLCRYWKCSKEEETKLLEVLIERGEDDFVRFVQCSFSPLLTTTLLSNVCITCISFDRSTLISGPSEPASLLNGLTHKHPSGTSQLSHGLTPTRQPTC